MTGIKTPIKVNEFAVITSAKKMKRSGLSNGDVVMVAATKVAPASAKDPYLQRIYVVALRFVDNILCLPNENNDYNAYLIDPRNLERLPDEEQQQLLEMLKKQYGQEDTATD